MIAILWISAALAGDPGTVLDPESYRFCHEPGVDSVEAMQFCPLLQHLPEGTCPGLRATCAGAVGPESGCNEATGGPPSGTPEGAPEPSRKMPDLGCDAPEMSGVQAAIQWGVAILVALLILVLARVLYQRFGARPAPKGATRPIPAGDDATPAEAEEVPDLPSTDLLAAARTAFARADYGEAVLLARGAALRRLAERGRLSIHRARTDREYVRSVRPDPAVHDDLRQVVRGVETHRWGGRTVDAEMARAVLDAAGRLVGLLALFGVFAPEARGADRHGPLGDAGLHDLLVLSGHDVTWRTAPLVEIDDSTQVLVVDLHWVGPDDADWAALRAWVEAGGVLVVAGDPQDHLAELGPRLAADEPALVVEGWLAEAGTEPPIWPADHDAVFAEEAYTITPIAGAPVEIAGAQVGGRVPLVSDAEGAVVVQLSLGDGVVVALADHALLANGALMVPENRAFLVDLFAYGPVIGGWGTDDPAPVELATRSYGRSESAPQDCMGTQALAEGRLLALVLQALALWGLVALWRGWAFAVPKDPPPTARIAFADHVEALARQLSRRGGRAWADRAVVKLWWGRLGPSGIEAAALRHGSSADDAGDLAARIGRVADGGDDPAAVEALWRLVK